MFSFVLSELFREQDHFLMPRYKIEFSFHDRVVLHRQSSEQASLARSLAQSAGHDMVDMFFYF